MKVKIGKYSEVSPDAQKIRDAVFVKEQQVDVEEEYDEYDESATHVVIYEGEDMPVATARLVLIDGVHYIGRVAVLKEKRGSGYGKIATQALIDWAAQSGVQEIVLHAQAYAQGFYEKLGFVPYGDVYMEVGIEHISMRKKLD